MKNVFFLNLVLGVVGFTAGCTVSRPLSGPGYDKDRESLTGNLDRVVVIAATNGILDRQKRTPFDRRSQEIYRNLSQYSGYLAGSIRLRLLGREIWTYSVWETEADLNNFLSSREHLDAVYQTDQAIKKMRSIRRSLPAKDVPTDWSEVEELLGQVPIKNYKAL